MKLQRKRKAEHSSPSNLLKEGQELLELDTDMTSDYLRSNTLDS